MDVGLLTTIFITLKVAIFASLITSFLGSLLGLWLYYIKGFKKIIIETFFLCPLFLPPVAIGLLILECISPQTTLGRLLENCSIEILLNWKGAVLAAVVISLPIQIKISQQAWGHIPKQLGQMTATLGKNNYEIFWKIRLPLALPTLLQGLLLAFARTIGEFGATVLVAGIIPGETDTVSLSLYQAIINGDNTKARHLALISILVAITVLSIVRLPYFNRGKYNEQMAH